MAILRQYDKRYNITYLVEATYTWDKVKRQSRSKRKVIGRVDPVTGEIVTTDGRMRRAKERKETQKQQDTQETKTSHKPSKTMYDKYDRLYCGATYLLDQIGEKTGLTKDLKLFFPKIYKQILSMAYYFILEEKSSLNRFWKWHHTHMHPYMKDIPSQRCSDIFKNIDQDAIYRFQKHRCSHRKDKEYLIYDTTTISSYSELLKQVKHGHNKENDKLPQLNLALVMGRDSELPFYYKKLAGNIPDVKTLKNLLYDLNVLGLTLIKLVIDTGFYSVENINAMLDAKLRFLVSMKKHTNFVRDEIDKHGMEVQDFSNYSATHKIYSMSIPKNWEYVHTNSKGEKTRKSRPVFVNLYFNPMKAATDSTKFDQRLAKYREELLMGDYNPKNEKSYKTYFTFIKTDNSITDVAVKDEVVRKARSYFGYFALLTNEKMDSITALKLYRNKDIIEKAFNNLKDRLDIRRLTVSSEQSLIGKLFVAFIALTYYSYIKKQMKAKTSDKTYTLTELLDRLDLIECFITPGGKVKVGEILEKQQQIFADMDIKPPTSLRVTGT